jgi:hypothetical protein
MSFTHPKNNPMTPFILACAVSFEIGRRAERLSANRYLARLESLFPAKEKAESAQTETVK